MYIVSSCIKKLLKKIKFAFYLFELSFIMTNELEKSNTFLDKLSQAVPED